MTINVGSQSSDMSWLFGSTNSFESSFADLATINSGSYKRLLTAYFDKVEDNKSDSTSKTEEKKSARFAKTAYEMAHQEVDEEIKNGTLTDTVKKKTDKTASLYKNDGKYSKDDTESMINALM